MANQLHYVFDGKYCDENHQPFLSLSQDQLNLTDDCFDEAVDEHKKNFIADVAA